SYHAEGTLTTVGADRVGGPTVRLGTLSVAARSICSKANLSPTGLLSSNSRCRYGSPLVSLRGISGGAESPPGGLARPVVPGRGRDLVSLVSARPHARRAASISSCV